jgi:plasmid maintenance system killer protein
MTNLYFINRLYLNAGKTLEDLKSPPGNRLEALRGVY